MVTLIQLFSVIIIYPWTRTQTRTRTWNTCALLVWACWNSLESSEDEKEKKTILHRITNDICSNRIWTIKSHHCRHLTISHTTLIQPHQPHLLSYRLFLDEQIKLTHLPQKRTFSFSFSTLDSNLRKRAFYVYVFEVRKHSSQTNGQCRLGGFW